MTTSLNGDLLLARSNITTKESPSTVSMILTRCKDTRSIKLAEKTYQKALARPVGEGEGTETAIDFGKEGHENRKS